MARLHHQRLILRHYFKVFLDEPVLHPVLAYLTCLSVCDQLIRIQRHVEVKVVLYHDLERFSLQAPALVFFDRFAVKLAFRTETVPVYATVFLVFLEKFRRYFLMVFLRDVAQRIFQRKDRLLFIQYLSAVGSPSYARLKFSLARAVLPESPTLFPAPCLLLRHT